MQKYPSWCWNLDLFHSITLLKKISRIKNNEFRIVQKCPENRNRTQKSLCDTNPSSSVSMSNESSSLSSFSRSSLYSRLSGVTASLPNLKHRFLILNDQITPQKKTGLSGMIMTVFGTSGTTKDSLIRSFRAFRLSFPWIPTSLFEDCYEKLYFVFRLFVKKYWSLPLGRPITILCEVWKYRRLSRFGPGSCTGVGAAPSAKCIQNRVQIKKTTQTMLWILIVPPAKSIIRLALVIPDHIIMVLVKFAETRYGYMWIDADRLPIRGAQLRWLADGRRQIGQWWSGEDVVG